MDEATAVKSGRLPIAAGILAAALGLGLAADLLVHDSPFGIGLSAFLTLVGIVAFGLHRFAKLSIGRPLAWLTVPILFFAGMFALRDADALRGLNFLSIVLLVGLMTMRKGASDLRIGSVWDYTGGLVAQWGKYLGDTIPLFNLEGNWKRIGNEGTGKTIRSLAVGITLALPLLMVFGALFMGADAGFEKLVNSAFHIDPESAVSHTFIVGLYSCWVGGFLYRLVLAPRTQSEATVVKPPPLGILEIGTILLALNLLFGLFVATQFRHFFGGDAVVQETANLGYGSYARRGFFELATVALLALPVLLGTHALLRRDSLKTTRMYRVLAGTLIVLLFAVISSAWLRMQICVDAYGITQPRLYVFAAIAWIGAVFAWFAGTVLRGRPERFAFGALAMFVGGVGILNVVNPDSLIAHVNTHRPEKSMDVTYLRGLSLDAVPELAASLNHLSGDKREYVQSLLSEKKQELQQRELRSWNLGAASAGSILGALTLPTPPPAPEVVEE